MSGPPLQVLRLLYRCRGCRAREIKMADIEGRRARIADAAITTLAERGSRGLTHRAVDEAASLPTGSTSYYYRSRAELLQAAVSRLAELDSATVRWEATNSPREAVVHILEASLSGAGYTRTLARYELVLEASRRPQLQKDLAAGTERLLTLFTTQFHEFGTEDGMTRARDLLALLDGLMLAEVASPAEHRRTPAERAAAIARFLDGPCARR
jgi:DNA-binding transcriptional regulator YbjK